MCQAELKVGHLKKPYVITVQTFQMAILLLFEKRDSISCKEIRETLQLNREQFQRYAVSLIDSKLLFCDTDVSALYCDILIVFLISYYNNRNYHRTVH